MLKDKRSINQIQTEYGQVLTQMNELHQKITEVVDCLNSFKTPNTSLLSNGGSTIKDGTYQDVLDLLDLYLKDLKVIEKEGSILKDG